MIILQEFSHPLKRVRFAPDGQTLATCGDRSGLRLWNREGANRSRLVQAYYHSDFTFTIDGTSLLYFLHNSIRSTNFVGEREEQIFKIPSQDYVPFLALQSSGQTIFLQGGPRKRRLECWSW